MSSGALRAAWEAVQRPSGGLRAAFDAAQPKLAGIHAEYASGNLAKRMARENANDADALASEEPSYATQALGGIASLARDIPGAEAVQAGARAITRGQSYTDALGDIRSAEASAPASVRIANRVIGGTVAAAALPSVGAKVATKLSSLPRVASAVSAAVGSPTAQAATLGGLSGALQAAPVSAKDRAIDTGVGTAVGGIVGKVADAGTNAIRSIAAPSLGKQFMARKAAMGAADAANYGAAEAEAAAAGGTSPAIQKALSEPDIAPYVKAVRDSRMHQGADDATVLREAYKLMSDRQGVLNRAMNATDDVTNGTRLGNANIGAAKSILMRAATSPSTKPALTLDIAPELHNVEPQVLQAERATLDGPVGTGPLSARTTAPTPTISEVLRNANNGTPLGMQGPDGPAFQLRGQAQRVQPGVEIGTPAMRIQTAPEETVPAAMPSFEKANQVHATFMGEQDAQTAGSKAAKTVMSGRQAGDKNLGTRSTEGFLSSIPGMSPEEADAALGGVLGRSKDAVHLTANPFSLFGVGSSAARAAKLTPLLQALEQQRGTAAIPVDLLRAFVGAEGHPTP